MKKLKVLDYEVKTENINQNDYISLTDIAKYKDLRTDYLISNWLHNKTTIEFLGLWEKLYNPIFNPMEFHGIKSRSILSVAQWVNITSAIGIVSKSGRYGGTYAHKDIAFEFAMWICRI